MKVHRILSGLLVAGLMTAAVNAKAAKPSSSAQKIVSIDSIDMLRKSHEGKKLEQTIQAEVKDFEAFVRDANTEIMAKQESITKQASILSKDALADKQQELARAKKNLQLKIEDKREVLTASIQKRQVQLRDKQLKVARKMRDENGWTLMVEKNAPFILDVADSIDKTEDVLKMVNAEFDKEAAATKKA